MQKGFERIINCTNCVRLKAAFQIQHSVICNWSEQINKDMEIDRTGTETKLPAVETATLNRLN